MISPTKRWILSVFGFLLFMTSLSAQDKAVTVVSLKDAIDYAWSNSLAVKNAQVNIADAEQQIIERRSIGLPQLTADFNFQRYLQVPVQPLPEAFIELIRALNPNSEVSGEASFFLQNNFTAGLNLDAMIFDGSYFVGLQAAKAYRNYVQVDLNVQRRNVKTNVVEAYLPVLLVNENLQLLEKNIGNLEKLLFETQQLYQEGFVEQLDVDRLELSLANLKVERDNLVRQKEIALSGLKFAMNYPVNDPLEVEESITDLMSQASNEDLTQTVDYSSRPEVALVDQGLELNELNIKNNKVGYLPTLRAYGTYQQGYQGNNSEDGFWAPTTFVGVRLSVPIFDGLYKKAVIQRARLDLEKSQNQKEELLNAISLEVVNARITYINTQERLENQRKNLNLAERIYNTTQIKYREGVGSSLEVTQAEQSLYDSQSNYTQAMYDLLAAKMQLDLALGK
jgi:outer membrane protein